MIQPFQPGTPGQAWIGCEGLVSLWHAVRSRSDLTILQRPTNHRWALDLKLADLDGNILWFGAEPMEGVPFNSEPAL